MSLSCQEEKTREGKLSIETFIDNTKDWTTKKLLQLVQCGKVNSYIGNPGIINSLDQTVLFYLVSQESVEGVKFALERGADPNLPAVWRDEGTRWYPLYRAFEHGSRQIVDLLLSHGARVNLVEDWKTSLLSNSIWPGKCLACVERAIQLGCVITRKHVQTIVWRWCMAYPLTDSENCIYFNIARYLYKIDKKCVNFRVSRNRWDGEDKTFGEWAEKMGLILYDQEMLHSFLLKQFTTHSITLMPEPMINLIVQYVGE